MVVIDSDLIIKFLRHKPKKAVEFLNELFESKKKLKTTIFNYAELIEGAYLTKNVPKNLRFLKEFLKNFEILQFNLSDAQLFSQIHAELIQNGTPIGDFDVLIGAMVLNRNEILITRNLKHFTKIPMLQTINWSQ